MSGYNCCFLTCIQVSQEAGNVVWYSCLFQNFPVCCDSHSQKLWSKSRFFLIFSCFFYDQMDLISHTSGFSKSSLNIWKFMVHRLLKPSLENFEHYFASLWDECNYAIVWTLFGVAFLWDWSENWLFSCPAATDIPLVKEVVYQWWKKKCNFMKKFYPFYSAWYFS